MRRYNSSYNSPPRRGYEGRERSPPRRGRGRYSGHRDENRSLLIRNIPLNCRPDDLRAPFERFGPVRDVYLPKNYYTGEPRGFAFVEFISPSDASEAQYQMNGRMFGGREITVVAATESRKRPEEMSRRTRVRDPPGGRRSSNYDRDYSRSASRSRSPRSPRRYSRGHQDSRSYSPEGRRPRSRSVSPKRHSNIGRSPREFHGEERELRRSYSNGLRGDRALTNGNEGMRYEDEGPDLHRRYGLPRRARPLSRSRSPSAGSPGISR